MKKNEVERLQIADLPAVVCMFLGFKLLRLVHSLTEMLNDCYKSCSFKFFTTQKKVVLRTERNVESKTKACITA